MVADVPSTLTWIGKSVCLAIFGINLAFVSHTRVNEHGGVLVD